MPFARKKWVESSSERPRVAPPSPTEVEIICYLDHCLEGRPEVEHFRNTVCSHLKLVVKVSWDFEKVEWHIRRLWQDFGIPGVGNPDYHSVYYHGSRVLLCFQEGTALGDQLKRRVDEIREQKAGERCDIRHRVTRNFAKQKNLNNHIFLGDDVPEYRYWTERTKITVEIPIHQKPGLEEPSGVAHKIAPSTASIAGSEELEACPSDDSHSVSNPDHLLALDERNPELILEQRTGKFDSSSSASGHSRVRNKHSQHGESELEQDRRYVDMVRRTKFLEKELIVARGQKEKATIALDSMKRSYADLKKCDDREIAVKLVQAREEVYSLQKRLTNRELLEKFNVSRRQYPIGPERAEIHNDMIVIESGIRKLWMFADAELYSHDQPAVEGNHDLSQLWCRAFGSLEATLQGSSLASVLRSLVSTALVEWVFENELTEPYLANNHRSDVLLGHLVSLGDEPFARNLEFATVTTIIEDDYCQRSVLPERARRLSSHLLTTLGSLLVPQTMGRKGSRNYVGVFCKDSDKVASLVDVAVKLKAKLLVGDWEYESVLPESGDQFQGLTMRTETTAGSACHVDMVLSPGLVRYACQQGKVGCNNFRKARKEPQEGIDCILQAVTLTK